MSDPADMAVIRAEFTLLDGDVLIREWTMRDVQGAPDLRTIPDWLDHPSRSWDHPQDPITYRGNVRAGRDAEARAFLGLSEARS